MAQRVVAEVRFPAGINLPKNPDGASYLSPRDSLAYLPNATSQRSEFNQ